MQRESGSISMANEPQRVFFCDFLVRGDEKLQLSCGNSADSDEQSLIKVPN